VRIPAGERLGVQKSTPTAALRDDDNPARHVCTRDVETRAAVAGHRAEEHHQDQDGEQPLLGKVDKPLDARPHRRLGAVIQRSVVRVHAYHGLDGADAADHGRDHWHPQELQRVTWSVGRLQEGLTSKEASLERNLKVPRWSQ
jgi:hypothetical protein